MASAGRRFVRLDGLDAVPAGLRGALVAIGSFDGFHRGHQYVLERLKSRAAAEGRPAMVLTFEPHPRDVFAPTPFMFRLTPAAAKARLAEAVGLDGIVIMPFSRDLSRIDAEDFVSRFLVEALKVAGVVVGADFHFGRDRGGTPAFLREAGARHGFSVDTLDLLPEGAEPVSSSRIRAALGQGDVATANALLGYHWFIEGEVVSGDRRGRELGFPTANITAPVGFGLAQGVYAVRGLLEGRRLDGVASFGKPMFGDAPPPFETHFFDFAEDIYGRPLSVALIGHIRGQERYDSLDALIAAIDRDAIKARSLLTTTAPLSDLDRHLGFFG
jgi:riboflavin kinase/FMN adenylyltransferase